MRIANKDCLNPLPSRAGGEEGLFVDWNCFWRKLICRAEIHFFEVSAVWKALARQGDRETYLRYSDADNFVKAAVDCTSYDMSVETLSSQGTIVRISVRVVMPAAQVILMDVIDVAGSKYVFIGRT